MQRICNKEIPSSIGKLRFLEIVRKLTRTLTSQILIQSSLHNMALFIYTTTRRNRINRCVFIAE